MNLLTWRCQHNRSAHLTLVWGAELKGWKFSYSWLQFIVMLWNRTGCIRLTWNSSSFCQYRSHNDLTQPYTNKYDGSLKYPQKIADARLSARCSVLCQPWRVVWRERTISQDTTPTAAEANYIYHILLYTREISDQIRSLFDCKLNLANGSLAIKLDCG